MRFRIGVLIALLLSVSGCQPVSSAFPEETPPAKEPAAEIRIMAYNAQDTRAKYLEYLAEKLPDISIVYEYVSLEYFNNELNTRLLSGQGPDIIEVGGETRLLARTNHLLELTGEPFIQKYMETGLAPFSIGDRVYAIPLQSWFEGMFYNKDIFAQFKLSPPRSFDGFIQIHKDLQAAGVKPQTMGAQSWEPLMKQSIGIVNNEFYADKDNAGFDREFDAGRARLAEEWLPAVTEWSRMIGEGCLTPDMLEYSYEQALDEFASGRAAMWQSGPWSLGAIRRINPDIDIGMFPIPGAEEGLGWLVGGPGSALAINHDSENTEAALRVLEYTSTPEAQAALIADYTGKSFLLGVDVPLDPVYDDCMAAIEAEHVYAPWTVAWTYGNPIVEAYGKSLQEVLAGSKSVEAALADADAVNDKMRNMLD
mgnify:FL=1